MMVPKCYRILPGNVTRIYVALFFRFREVFLFVSKKNYICIISLGQFTAEEFPLISKYIFLLNTGLDFAHI